MVIWFMHDYPYAGKQEELDKKNLAPCRCGYLDNAFKKEKIP